MEASIETLEIPVDAALTDHQRELIERHPSLVAAVAASPEAEILDASTLLDEIGQGLVLAERYWGDDEELFEKAVQARVRVAAEEHQRSERAASVDVTEYWEKASEVFAEMNKGAKNKFRGDRDWPDGLMRLSFEVQRELAVDIEEGRRDGISAKAVEVIVKDNQRYRTRRRALMNLYVNFIEKMIRDEEAAAELGVTGAYQTSLAELDRSQQADFLRLILIQAAEEEVVQRAADKVSNAKSAERKAARESRQLPAS
jgi:hypothetical protein